MSIDARCFSEANVTALTVLGCRPLVPPDCQLHRQAIPATPEADRQQERRWRTGCAAASARRTVAGSMLVTKRLSSRSSVRSSRVAAIDNSCCAECGRCAANGRSSVPRTMCASSGLSCAGDTDAPARGCGPWAEAGRGVEQSGVVERRQVNPSVAVRIWDAQERLCCAQVNVGQAPSRLRRTKVV